MAEPGKEEAVRTHAARLDKHAKALLADVGHLPEPMLLLLAGIRALAEADDSGTAEATLIEEGTRAIDAVADEIRALASEMSR